MSHSSVLEKVRTVIEQYHMLEKGDTVVVGLSGGADSMSLLSVLCELKTEYDLEIVAAHVDHGIRGAEALRDAEFCKQVCKDLGVDIKVMHIDVPSLAKERGESEELAGRFVRYEFFVGLAGASGKIATAHNAQDSVETLILNLCRGSGLKGLTGIPPVRTITHEATCTTKCGSDCSKCSGCETTVIRPLITCTREEIEDYLKEKGLSFVTDSTNLTDDYTRNKVRHNIIPELVSINGNAINNINRCIASCREDSDFIEDAAAQLIEYAKTKKGFNIEKLKEAEKPILCRAISKIVYDACGNYPEKVHIEKTIEMMNANRYDQVQVPSGAFVRVDKGTLSVVYNKNIEK